MNLVSKHLVMLNVLFSVSCEIHGAYLVSNPLLHIVDGSQGKQGRNDMAETELGSWVPKVPRVTEVRVDLPTEARGYYL